MKWRCCHFCQNTIDSPKDQREFVDQVKDGMQFSFMVCCRVATKVCLSHVERKKKSNIAFDTGTLFPKC